MRTSCARGGATSTSSSLRGSPAAQQTAALHLIGFPAVSDMVNGQEQRLNVVNCCRHCEVYISFAGGLMPGLSHYRSRSWAAVGGRAMKVWAPETARLYPRKEAE